MNSKNCVLITSRYPDDLLVDLARETLVVMPASDAHFFNYAEVLERAGRVSAIINQGEISIDPRLIAAAPALRIVANASIGINNFEIDFMRQRGIWGTNTPGAFVDATADCTMGLLLMLARRLGEAERFVRAGRWRQFEPGRWDGTLLRGHTLGLVGFGRIGRAVSRRARAFGLHVIHHTRRRNSHRGWRSLDVLLEESDFVSLHVPLNDESRALIDARRLALMKPSAALINMARGAVVDQAALVEALRTSALGGAGLDVFADEPYIPAELYSMENVVLTPHLGGGSRHGRREAQALCIENVHRVLGGQSPREECIALRPNFSL